MALKMNCKFQAYEQDVFVPNVYIRVQSINARKNIASANIQFCKDSESEIIKNGTYNFVPDLNGENFIKQAYLYLKTLPEFAGATDC